MLIMAEPVADLLGTAVGPVQAVLLVVEVDLVLEAVLETVVVVQAVPGLVVVAGLAASEIVVVVADPGTAVVLLVAAVETAVDLQVAVVETAVDQRVAAVETVVELAVVFPASVVVVVEQRILVVGWEADQARTEGEQVDLGHCHAWGHHSCPHQAWGDQTEPAEQGEDILPGDILPGDQTQLGAWRECQDRDNLEVTAPSASSSAPPAASAVQTGETLPQ